MKKITVKKLQLKKGVVAQLNKESMNQAAGGNGSLLTCPCITEYPTQPCVNHAGDVIRQLLTQTCGIYC